MQCYWVVRTGKESTKGQKLMNHKNEISSTKKKAIRLKMFSMTQTLLQKTKEINNFIL